MLPSVARCTRRLVVLLAVCLGGIAAARPAVAQAAGPAPGWYEITRLPTIVAYLDTARIKREPAGVARIWFRFVYTEPMVVGGDTATRVAAAEMREELDCAHRRTRDLELRMETAAHVTTGQPFPASAWQSIDTHALNSGVFLVACRALGHPIPAAPGA